MASLAGWRFCPRCASALAVENGEATCPSCGFTAYAQSAPAVSAFVVEDGRTLLGLRAHEPDAGRWDLLGGFLEEGEDPIDGLRRELLEETGLEVEPGAYLGAYSDSYGEAGTTVLNLVFETRVVAGDMAPADDVAELRWFALEDLPPSEELAFTWVARFLDDHGSFRSHARRLR
jgi:ADP-ribose pyrophosphatase YjhB (NUDIX family)